jgi:hypothetical protein
VSVNSIQEIQDQDRQRREFAEAGGDWAFQILTFLRSSRRLEITLGELKATQTYAQSTEQEKRALEFVTGQTEEHPEIYVDGEDRRKLRERDDFLVRFANGEPLLRSDWASDLHHIPVRVASREKGDRDMFPTAHYPITPLFQWVFEKAR